MTKFSPSVKYLAQILYQRVILFLTLLLVEATQKSQCLLFVVERGPGPHHRQRPVRPNLCLDRQLPPRVVERTVGTALLRPPELYARAEYGPAAIDAEGLVRLHCRPEGAEVERSRVQRTVLREDQRKRPRVLHGHLRPLPYVRHGRVRRVPQKHRGRGVRNAPDVPAVERIATSKSHPQHAREGVGFERTEELLVPPVFSELRSEGAAFVLGLVGRQGAPRVGPFDWTGEVDLEDLLVPLVIRFFALLIAIRFLHGQARGVVASVALGRGAAREAYPPNSRYGRAAH
mmetsp:Transcript_17277/g.40172  ORF Transcript_17277/g.40172 Transcript_17277/m.40172 type:complete len:288 (+) Transcript_17277:1647-2510(+)